MDSNIFRYIKASIVKHVDANRDGIKLSVDGQKRSTKSTETYMNLRIDNFDYVDESSGGYKCTLTVSINIVHCMNDNNIYDIFDAIGTVTDALNQSIHVYKYGGDSSHFGCLRLVNPIRTVNYGQLNPSQEIQQAVIEADYKMID